MAVHECLAFVYNVKAERASQDTSKSVNAVSFISPKIYAAIGPAPVYFSSSISTSPAKSFWMMSRPKLHESLSSAIKRVYSRRRRSIYVEMQAQRWSSNKAGRLDTHVGLHILPSPVIQSKLPTLLGTLLGKVVSSWHTAIGGTDEESRDVVQVRVIDLHGLSWG
jgi:hypothetical protein